MNGPINESHKIFLQRCMNQLSGDLSTKKVSLECIEGNHILRIPAKKCEIIWWEHGVYVAALSNVIVEECVDFDSLCRALVVRFLRDSLTEIRPTISYKEAAEKVLEEIVQALKKSPGNAYAIETDDGVSFKVVINNRQSVRVFIQTSDLEGVFIDDDDDDSVVIPE